MKRFKLNVKIAAGVGACVLASAAAAQTSGWSYQQISDALHAIIESDRTVYTRLIVNRLQNEEKVIKATEHWKDEKTLVLPAQMLRYGSEGVAEKNPGFSYSLLSLWPINKQNAPKTALEKKGLEAIAKEGAKPFYGEETLGGKKFFTAVYPDKAVARACITCHNDHKDTPRRDFKMGETMGGVVVRLPMR